MNENLDTYRIRDLAKSIPSTVPKVEGGEMNTYHLSIPSGMHTAVVEALKGWDIPEHFLVPIAGVAAGAVLKWHTENPLVPITEKTRGATGNQLEVRSENEVRLTPYMLKHVRSAFESADLKKYHPDHTHMRITEDAVTVWSDESMRHSEDKEA